MTKNFQLLIEGIIVDAVAEWFAQIVLKIEYPSLLAIHHRKIQSGSAILATNDFVLNELIQVNIQGGY